MVHVAQEGRVSLVFESHPVQLFYFLCRCITFTDVDMIASVCTTNNYVLLFMPIRNARINVCVCVSFVACEGVV